MKQNVKFYILFILIAIISFSLGALTLSLSSQASGSKLEKEIPFQDNEPLYFESGSKGLLGGEEYGRIPEIVEKVGSAVVNIDVVKMEKARIFDPFKDFGFGFRLEPEFRHFFEDKIVPIKGAGSGFIINKKGYILTNHHVVKNADKIKVTLKDGRSFNAKTIGSDATLDLAVIKIDAGNLPTVLLGDSTKIKPGQWVVAIGNPYQFANTVTVGIISATGRALRDIGKQDLIQTDAAINPGNSGGPLIDMAGKVIGINVAIAAGAEGIGFAIPINSAKEVLNDLITKGKVIRPWLGIYMRDVDEKIAQYLDLPLTTGVVITDVVPDSPAAKMGLRRYDVIREIDKKKVEKGEDVQKIIKDRKPGDKIMILVFRDGHTTLITGNIGEAP